MFNIINYCVLQPQQRLKRTLHKPALWQPSAELHDIREGDIQHWHSIILAEERGKKSRSFFFLFACFALYYFFHVSVYSASLVQLPYVLKMRSHYNAHYTTAR